MGEEKVRFGGREFTVIPPNFAHTTTSEIPDNISKWEYLFIDVEGFLESISDNRDSIRKNDTAYLFKGNVSERRQNILTFRGKY